MRLLHYIFNIIDPDYSTNWLSVKFHQWKYLKHEEKLKYAKTRREEEYIFFDVKGAGELSISKLPNYRTGGANGYSFGVSWTDYPFIGGVIDSAEANRMAKFILNNSKGSLWKKK